MDATGICDMGLSPTLTYGHDKEDSKDSLIFESEIANICSGPCNGKDE